MVTTPGVRADGAIGLELEDFHTVTDFRAGGDFQWLALFEEVFACRFEQGEVGLVVDDENLGGAFLGGTGFFEFHVGVDLQRVRLSRGRDYRQE